MALRYQEEGLHDRKSAAPAWFVEPLNFGRRPYCRTSSLDASLHLTDTASLALILEPALHRRLSPRCPEALNGQREIVRVPQVRLKSQNLSGYVLHLSHGSPGLQVQDARNVSRVVTQSA